MKAAQLEQIIERLMPLAYSRYYTRLGQLQRRLGVLFIDHLPMTIDSEVKKLFEAGLKFAEQNYWDRAYQIWNEGKGKVREDELAALHFLCAGCLVMRGQMAQARQELGQAAEILRHTGNKNGLAVVLYLLVTLNNEEQNRTSVKRQLSEVIALCHKTGNDDLRAKALVRLAEVYHHDGQDEPAIDCHRQALRVFELKGNFSAASGQYRSIGDIHLARGELDKARAAYEDSLHLARENRSRMAEAEGLLAIGIVHRLQRDYKRAIDVFDRAMRIFQEINYFKGQAQVLHELALAHEKYNEPDIAREFFEQALTFARRLRDAKLIIDNLLGLAMNALLRYHLEEAQRLIEEAQVTANTCGRDQEVVRVKIVLARFFIATRKFERAVQLLNEIVELPVSVLDLKHRTKAYLELTRALIRSGRISAAERALKQFWHLLKGIQDEELTADGWFETGLLKFVSKDMVSARRFFEQAYTFHQKVNASRAMAIDLLYLGKLLYQEQMLTEAPIRLTEALRIAQESKDINIQAEIITLLGDIKHSLHDNNSAVSNYSQALELYRTIGDEQQQAQVLMKLGMVFYQDSVWDKARPNLEQALMIFQRLNDRKNAESVMSLLNKMPADDIGLKLATGA
ncbi:MAG: tetratricopeptide repeat protein [candidate division WOR-3 bacterium]|nr:tetratricopeptide repeat protein [candidate division WOR-3 bacterium]